MPFSFTQIEKDKSRLITRFLTVLTVIYFLTFWLIFVILRMLFYKWISISPAPGYSGPYEVEVQFRMFNVYENVFVLIFSLFVALFHWHIVSRGLVARIMNFLRVKPPDPMIFSHKQFANILEELSAATGGYYFEGCIVPSMSINAFALSDLNGRDVIGVTEGLLFKLNRAQTESVVAHEAGHILKGDAVETTLLVSIFNLPTEMFRDAAGGAAGPSLFLTRISLQGSFIFALFNILLFLSRTVGQLLNMFISRQREFRADAIAIRLTRNPLSLAEALFLATYHWSGSGSRGEFLSQIYIVRPRYNRFKEEGGVLAKLLSTHPPVRQRISILLDIAHTDYDVFEQSMRKTYQNLFGVMKAQPKGEIKWIVRKDRKWEGPYCLADIKEADWLNPNMLVKRVGEAVIMAAEGDELLKKLLDNSRTKKTANIFCPKCYVFLNPVYYNGVALTCCRHCEGVSLPWDDVTKILKMEDTVFGADVPRLAGIMLEDKPVNKYGSLQWLYSDYLLICPKCQNYKEKMIRRFYSQTCRVEVDLCPICQETWFDKDELEILRYLHAHDRCQDF